MPSGYSSISTLDKGQKNVLNQLMQQLSQMFRGGGADIQQNPLYQSGASYLQNLLSGSPESTSAFEAPYLRQFNEQIVPGLAERFAGMGAGAQSSSAFRNALGSASSGLQENLAALRAGLQGQASDQALQYAQQPFANLSGLAGLGLGTQTKAFMPKQQSFWQQLLTSGAGGVGQGVGSLGGMWGLSKLFGGQQQQQNQQQYIG
jgi:hypothetical protein